VENGTNRDNRCSGYCNSSRFVFIVDDQAIVQWQVSKSNIKQKTSLGWFFVLYFHRFT
jgi:hypothetical protein